MADLLSLDVENPFRYLLTTIIVWVGVSAIVQFALFDGDLTGTVVIGVFGGFSFGVVSLLLGKLNAN